jgi:hypothetical protein
LLVPFPLDIGTTSAHGDPWAGPAEVQTLLVASLARAVNGRLGWVRKSLSSASVARPESQPAKGTPMGDPGRGPRAAGRAVEGGIKSGTAAQPAIQSRC